MIRIQGGLTMEKAKYESPEFRFQELFLFEGVAEKCWCNHITTIYVFYDKDRDDYHDSNEPILYTKTFGGETLACAKVTGLVLNAVGDIQDAVDDFSTQLGQYWPSMNVTGKISSQENSKAKYPGYIPIHS
jgi:hypothetical protein